MNEKRLSLFTVSVGSASIVFALLGLLMIFGTVSAAGEHNLISSPLFWKGAALFGAYAVALYAVATLPGKSRRRRLVSWAFSATFHAAVVAYVAVVMAWGFVAAAVLLMPEVAAMVLSLGGLSLAAMAS